ncbi:MULTISPECIES: DUF4377 domain-containing protein [unclassified Carboxylicivirga]|uniref:DUF4377 domain-containing protein n=1 Tax=Carboxylicivirga TaxID=1628153 RepID=UPI003D32C12A
MKQILIFCCAALLAACSVLQKKQKPQPKPNGQVVYEVAPYKVDCTGVGPMKCLLVRKSEQEHWQYFYAPIKGFTHTPGTSYTVAINTHKRSDVPADASSISYELAEIIDSAAYCPPAHALYDIWGVMDLKGQKPLSMNCELTLEINLNNMTVMGTAGCNHFKGKISTSEGSNRLSITKLSTTKKMCPCAALESSYLNALEQVNAFFRFNQELYLMANDEVVIKCRRMD